MKSICKTSGQEINISALHSCINKYEPLYPNCRAREIFDTFKEVCEEIIETSNSYPKNDSYKKIVVKIMEMRGHYHNYKLARLDEFLKTRYNLCLDIKNNGLKTHILIWLTENSTQWSEEKELAIDTGHIINFDGYHRTVIQQVLGYETIPFTCKPWEREKILDEINK